MNITRVLLLLCTMLLAGRLVAIADESSAAADSAHNDGMETFYLERSFDEPYDDVRARLIDALTAEKFLVLTEIVLSDKFKEKLDVDIPRTEILGACASGIAHRAWQIDRHIGVLLPCTVVIAAQEDGSTVVMIRNPRGLAQANPEWEAIGEEVHGKMQNVLAAL